jgi:prepilin peptidase CpaA
MTFRDLYPLSWETLLFPIGFVVVGFFLFLLKIMGAGDSKYLASLFLITPGEFHAIFFEKIVGATIVVGAILLLFRGTQDFQRIKSYALSIYWKGIKETIKSNFSYAPVVLLAWILFGIGKQ